MFSVILFNDNRTHCNGKNINVTIIGIKKDLQTKQSCSVEKIDSLKKGEMAVWKSETELAECAKEIFHFTNGTKPIIRVQTSTSTDFKSGGLLGLYCPKWVQVKVDEKIFCARMERKYFTLDLNTDEHLTVDGKC